MLIVGIFLLVVGLAGGIFYWIFIGLMLIAAAFGLIWRDAPITDHRSKPKEPRRRRWIA